jgi:ribonuclease HI
MKNSTTSSKIIIFTDGSYIPKLNVAGYGIFYPNGELPNVSRKFKREPLTNQRAELYAIYKAIKQVQDLDINRDIHIYSDSEYSIKSLTIWIKAWKKNNWKSSTGKDVMNQDIITHIDKKMSKHLGKISFTHVRAHTNKDDFNSRANDAVDKLAKSGALS